MSGEKHFDLRRVLTVVLILMVIAAEGWFLARSLVKQRVQPEFAYLTKVGDAFVVFWRESEFDSEPLAVRHASLADAVQFARRELNLQARRPENRIQRIDKMWIDDSRGTSVLHWKPQASRWVHRLTFREKSEAETFAAAFEMGAYRPSPVGHSIVLLPPEK